MPNFTLLVQGKKAVSGTLDLNSQPTTLPTPVPKPNGTFYSSATIGRFGRIYHDDVVYGYSRTHDLTSGIRFTNEIQPLREYKLKDGNYRVFPTSKCVVYITGTEWEKWCRDLMGNVVFEKFREDGYGFMDNGPDKLHCLPCGGNLVYETFQITQNGKWSLIATQDFTSPVNRNLTYENAPHLFIKQYIVFSIGDYEIGWVVDKGEVGGMGDVVFPRVTKTLSALESNLIEFQRKPPFETVLYNESIIEEYNDNGVTRIRERTDLVGVPVVVEEICYSGSDTYARVGTEWYLVEKMLVRGDYNDKTKAGNWMDFRKYWGETRKAHPPAVIGWTYAKDVTLFQRFMDAIKSIIDFIS